ncbi:hypothetical protein BJ742DRAFT_854899 [Cladochytrium replicatum]|nr:hypothetical protein BJ742DRAFT_854899 [Cladochytrium replicatum]
MSTNSALKTLEKHPPAPFNYHAPPESATTSYWTLSEGYAIRTGFSCRECRLVIQKGEAVTVRDGRKMRLFYHRECFSGDPDPRTQPNSSYSGELKSVIAERAPSVKGVGKWSVERYGYAPNYEGWADGVGILGGGKKGGTIGSRKTSSVDGAKGK